MTCQAGKSRKVLPWVVGGICCCLFGLSAPGISSEFSPFAFRLGDGIQVIPQLVTKQIYDSNISGDVGAGDDGWLSMIEPRLIIEARPMRNKYQLDLSTRHANYRGTSRDDFWDLDVKLWSRQQHDFDRELEFKYQFLRVREYQDPISGSQYDLDQRYHQNLLSASLQTGAHYAPLQLTISTRLYDFVWETNRTQTRDGDHQLLEVAFEAEYDALSEAEWLVSGQLAATRLPNAVQEQGNYLQLMSGLRWHGLDPIEGQFQLGFGQVGPYGESQIDTTRRLLWQARLDWQLQERVIIAAEALSRIRLPELTAKWQRETLYRLQWRQQWQQDYASSLNVGFLREQALDASDEASERRFFMDLHLHYDFSRWLRLGGGYFYGAEPIGDISQRLERHRLQLSAQLSF